jgi:hypothetical protein
MLNLSKYDKAYKDAHDDLSLDYLAGKKSGNPFITYKERALASKGQVHPITNYFCAMVDGPLKATAAVSLTIAGYALYSGAFTSVFGSVKEIRAQCAINLGRYYGEEFKAVLDWTNPAEITAKLSKLFEFSDARTIEKMFRNYPTTCSIYNLWYAMYDVVSAHPYLTAAGLVMATAFFTLRQKSSAEASEAKAREKLASRLQERFEYLANKLKENVKNGKAGGHETALAILNNQYSIKKELMDLNIFKSKKIERIMKPLADSVLEIQTQQGSPSHYP